MIVVAEDSLGQEAQATLTIRVFQAPSPDFEASPTSGSAPLIVRFLDESSGDIIERFFDFDGDGTRDAELPEGQSEIEWRYETAGTYQARLTVVGHAGAKASTTRQIRVLEPKSEQ